MHFLCLRLVHLLHFEMLDECMTNSSPVEFCHLFCYRGVATGSFGVVAAFAMPIFLLPSTARSCFVFIQGSSCLLQLSMSINNDKGLRQTTFFRDGHAFYFYGYPWKQLERIPNLSNELRWLAGEQVTTLSFLNHSSTNSFTRKEGRGLSEASILGVLYSHYVLRLRQHVCKLIRK